MPNHNETKNSITNYVYKADVKALRDKYKYEGTVIAVSVSAGLTGLGYLVGLCTGPIGQLITATIVFGLGLAETFVSQRALTYNLYSDLYDEMNQSDNQVIYVKITQPMIYKVSQEGEGWISNGVPTINRYYQDW